MHVGRWVKLRAHERGVAHLGLFFLIIVALVVVLVFNRVRQNIGPAQTNQEQTAQTAPELPSKLKGFSYSPKSTSATDINGFYKKASEAGNAVTWAGPWRDLGKNAPVTIMKQAEKNDLVPILAIGVYSQGADILYEPLDEANRAELVTIAEEFASKNKPPYLIVGVEMNILYEKRPAEFDNFVSLYSATYDAVKRVSPDTKIATAFQLEKMKGLKGGLYGGANNTANNEWELLERFNKSDLAAFTTYPGLVYPAPADIPADHYTSVAAMTDKPLAFIEVGWHAEDQGLQAYAGSEAKQAAFATRYFELIKGTDTTVAIWTFLYDQEFPAPFKGSGLITAQASERQAYGIWQSTDL